MKRNLIYLLMIVFSVSFSFAQINIKGNIYKDSLLINSLEDVKLILKTNIGKETFIVNQNGKFNISTKNEVSQISITFKKKGYKKLKIKEITNDIEINVILKKRWTTSDSFYNYLSKIFVF